MRTAARDTVRRIFNVTDADDGDVLFDGERLAQRQMFGLLLRVKMTGDDRRVAPNRLIGAQLGVFGHFPGECFKIRIFLQADIDRHIIVSHVKTAVDTAVFAVEHTAEDMLAAVTLHIVEAARPIQR